MVELAIEVARDILLVGLFLGWMASLPRLFGGVAQARLKRG